MMKGNNDIDFDREIRSLLEEASADVPSGAWEAVHGRMVRRRRAVMFGRLGVVGAAIAASLALVLTLRPSDATLPVTESESVVAQVSDLSVDEAIEVPVSAPEADEAVKSVVREAAVRRGASGMKAAASREVVSAKMVAAATQAADETPASAGEGLVAAANTENAGSVTVSDTPAKAENKDSKVGNDNRQSVDPFALMDYEDALKSRAKARPSLSVNGLVGTNDATSRVSRGAAFMGASSAATASVPSGVREDSESVYDIPFSVGVSARIPIAGRWSVGAGVNYSLLSRTFTGSYAASDVFFEKGQMRHSVHYIGIPVNVYFDVLSGGKVGMYTFAGASIEKGILQQVTYPANGSFSTVSQDVPGLQGSAALGLGVSFRLSDHVGLYLDPSARYYFGEGQPKTIRTQQPFMFNLELGLRFQL